MKKVNYRIRAAASKDLAGIWEYTFKRWSKDQADRYHGLIISEIEYVNINPKIPTISIERRQNGLLAHFSKLSDNNGERFRKMKKNETLDWGIFHIHRSNLQLSR